MEKQQLFITSLLLIISILVPCSQSNSTIARDPKSVQKWFQNLPNAKEKLTKLHFFFHDTVSGKNPTSIAVVPANSSLHSPTGFGLINMIDDPLTSGPEPSSRTVGRAQGIFASASLDSLTLLMTLNFVFTDGEYNGSTLSVLGRNPILDKYREMPILGGSGLFRLARGIATVRTVWFNLTTLDAVVEYHVVVLHY